MKLSWNKNHGIIFSELIKELEKNKIRYFILRNYLELPNENSSKDVDIIIEPGTYKIAKNSILKVFKSNNIQYYREEEFGKIHSFWGGNIDIPLSIHIDLIEGYLAKGFEIFAFDELYKQTITFNNFRVLNPLFSGIMLYIYKQFGYKKPKMKEEYKKEIVEIYTKFPKEFENIISSITNKEFAQKTCKEIKNYDFDSILKNNKELSKLLRKYVIKKRPFKTLLNCGGFIWQRLKQSVIFYRKYSVNLAVLAPDGTGKTTFLEKLLEQLNFYRVLRAEDNGFSIYHFRPNILPNLGEIGEKAGVMKQDVDFTNPHRRKPAGLISSIIRISYYTFDYILGWNICVRKDSRRNKWSIFDRYSYDLLVDPLRTRLNLPQWIRKAMVKLTPKPNIIFCLDADADIIYKRKQELELKEIDRQLKEYRKIAQNDKRVIILDATKEPSKIVEEAISHIFSYYMVKL